MERKINSYSSSYLLLLRERMDFQLEWIEILNYTISKILTEKMILILNIGMNWKTDLLSQLLGLFCFLGDVGGDLENLERWQG